MTRHEKLPLPERLKYFASGEHDRETAERLSKIARETKVPGGCLVAATSGFLIAVLCAMVY